MTTVIAGVIAGYVVLTRPSGRIFGTTREVGVPDSPVRRRVQIVGAAPNAHGHVFPALASFSTWTWADENGNWEVHDIDPTLKYHAIAYDHTGQYDPVIKLNLIPTVD